MNRDCTFFACLILAVVSLLVPAPARGGDDDLKIVHINIGQGDATLILGPRQADGTRVSVLVDAGNIPLGGGKDGGKIVLEALGKCGVEILDFFVVTHYDADHIGGAIAGSDSMHGLAFLLGPDNAPGSSGDDDGDGDADWLDDPPTKMITPDPEELGTGDDIRVMKFVDRGDTGAPTTQAFKKYKGMAEAKPNARVTITTQGDVNSFAIDLKGGATMTCLAANGFVRDRSAKVAKVNTENEKSLCFLLRLGGFDYLIGGDTIGREFGRENAHVEAAIGEYLRAEAVNVDVLHVNHHGANNASDDEFLEAVAAEVAIISVGNGNSHEHPSDEALARLADAGVYRIIQTEWGTTQGVIPESVRGRQAIYQGDIVLTTDGVSYDISTSRSFGVDE